MINLTFPDGSIRSFDQHIDGYQLASNISTSLAKKAFLLEVNSQIVDLSYVITQDAKIRILMEQDPESIEIIRHDCAHLLAQAVQQLFPQVKPTIGPVIENGFYYDFANITLTLEDLQKIEERMHLLSKANLAIKRLVYSKQEAINLFKSLGQEYKVELVESIPDGEEVSLYQQGDFIDLCRGPHGPSTVRLKYFKLTKLAGAYWRGDSNKPMLQRIYGVAFASETDLDNYFIMLEEAAARDHRKIGKDMGLFHLQEEAPGMVFWHPKGRELYLVIEQYIRQKLKNAGYVEVKTPVLLSKSLWEKSGHWDKFRENMFVVEDEGVISSLKPMNCPCHIQIFKQNIRSYRDLPMRMAEFGFCHRNEPSGSLHGLMRVRGFVQDDAHIFCTPEQVISETIAFCDLLREIYADFGFYDVQVKFSDRPEVRAGSDEVWDKAERTLKDAVAAVGIKYDDNKGEGAFYGPKLEFVLKDAIGRDWQCGTLQVDFVLPERLDASYTTRNGQKERPVMLHRVIIGTFERFIGILIEQYKGRLPLWLAPVQIVVATITQAYEEHAKQIFALLRTAGIRCELDIENEKIGYKIRKHACAKVPLVAIIGKKEVQEGGVTVSRTCAAQKQDEWIAQDNLVPWLQDMIAKID